MLFRLAGAAVLTITAALAHDPITTKLTWSREVSRLFLKRCMGCHQTGGAAPFPLTTYAEARPWAVAIRDEVAGRTMPPWGAVKGFGEFRDDPSLGQEEISLIVNWVNGGAPEGEKELTAAESPKAFAWAEAAGTTVALTPGFRLRHGATLLALGAKGVPENAEARVAAVRPDGSVEPLLWIKNWKAKFPHDFVLRNPLTLEAGTRVEVAGDPVTLELVLRSPGKRRAAARP